MQIRKLLLFTLSTLTLSMWGCSLNEPQLPSWEVALTRIPIISSDTVNVGSELQGDDPDDTIQANAEGELFISIDGQEEISIADQMNQKPINSDPFDGTVGNFDVSSSSGTNVQIGIFDAFPTLFAGTGAVPASTLPTIDRPFTMDNFSEMTLVSGTLNLTLNNFLPWDLGQPINVELIDAVNGSIGTVSFTSRVSAGGSSLATLDLSGKTLSNSLTARVTGSDQGSGGSNVTINGAEEFNLDITLVDLVASSATAKIPQQTFNINDVVDINSDSLKVINADISSGELILEFSSEFNFPVELELTLPDINDALDNTIVRIINLSANAVGHQEIIDLANSEMTLNGGDLAFDIVVTIKADPNSNTQVMATDKLVTSVSTSQLEFSRMTADMNMGVGFPSFENDGMDIDFDLPDIQFNNIEFVLVFSNTPADMSITLNMMGTKEDSPPTDANYAFDLAGGMDNTVVLSKSGVTVNGASSGSGSGLLEVINSLPEKFSFGGSALINDDNAVLDGNPLIIDYAMNVPFEFSVAGGAKLEAEEPDTLDFDEDTRRNLRNNFNGGAVELVLANGTAIGGSIKIRVGSFSDNFANASNWPELISLTFAAGTTDAEGNVINPDEDQELDISLTKERVIQLSNADLLYWEVILDPIPHAKIKNTDRIILRKGFLTGSMTIDSDLFDSGK